MQLVYGLQNKNSALRNLYFCFWFKITNNFFFVQHHLRKRPLSGHIVTDPISLKFILMLFLFLRPGLSK